MEAETIISRIRSKAQFIEKEIEKSRAEYEITEDPDEKDHLAGWITTNKYLLSNLNDLINDKDNSNTKRKG